MPKIRPDRPYAVETEQNRKFLDESIALFFHWLTDPKNTKAAPGLALLKEMGQEESRAELISMFDDGTIAITKIGEDIGWVYYDDYKKQYLPFGPLICACHSKLDPLRN